jgi:hypothetical protein
MGCLGIGPLVRNLAKLGPSEPWRPTVSTSGKRSGSQPEPHWSCRPSPHAQALSDNGVRDGGSSRKDACANLVGPSGALVVKAREFAPLASPGAVHHVTFVVVYRHHFEKFFYTEKKR